MYDYLCLQSNLLGPPSSPYLFSSILSSLFEISLKSSSQSKTLPSFRKLSSKLMSVIVVRSSSFLMKISQKFKLEEQRNHSQINSFDLNRITSIAIVCFAIFTSIHSNVIATKSYRIRKFSHQHHQHHHHQRQSTILSLQQPMISLRQSSIITAIENNQSKQNDSITSVNTNDDDGGDKRASLEQSKNSISLDDDEFLFSLFSFLQMKTI
ncbi:Sodium-driven chloride bicarbonate exchanger [Sarcoptes scabiei]|nr:Sodium-driven chloride bicarbonate exchanger [Sarcoptes scabiei]